MKCLTSCLAHPWNKTGILKKTNESENWLLWGYTFLLLMLCNCQGTAGKVVRMSWLHWRPDLGVFFYDGVLKIMADCSSCVQCVRDDQDLFMEECFLPTVIEKNLFIIQVLEGYLQMISEEYSSATQNKTLSSLKA